MPLMSLRAYARHRGCALRAVQKAIETGRITLSADGKVDSAAADASWELATDHSKRRDPLGAEPRSSGDDAARAEAEGDGPEADEPGGVERAKSNRDAKAYARARAARETYVAQIKKLELDELAGTLVRAAEVEKAIFEATRAARDAMLNIPNRIAAELASETDPHRIHTRLTAEINLALEELANGFGERAADGP
jgi:hypothetical protein